MNGALTAAIPIAVALIGALVGWWRSARKLSGKIETSEATELWKESAAIRADLREEVRRLTDRLATCEDTNRLLAAANMELRKRVQRLEQELLEARAL